MHPLSKTPEDFWASVEKLDSNSCWLWLAGRDIDGYGTLRYQTVDWRSHRLAWFLTNGPIPDGLHVLHSCDNPPCCNPAHLFLGTNADNMKDKARKGRANKGVPQSAEAIAARAAGLRGVPKSAEHRAKLSAARQGWKPSAELSAKLTAANERRRQNARR